MEMVVLMAMLVAAVVCACFMWKVGYESICCYWATPRRIRKIMEKQGVRGPKPRFLVGNILDMASLLSNSTAKDMDSIHHDLVPRLLPHFIVWSSTYGTYLCLSRWMDGSMINQ